MKRSKLVKEIQKQNAEIMQRNRAKIDELYQEHLRKRGELNAETKTEQHGVLEECETNESK